MASEPICQISKTSLGKNLARLIGRGERRTMRLPSVPEMPEEPKKMR